MTHRTFGALSGIRTALVMAVMVTPGVARTWAEARPAEPQSQNHAVPAPDTTPAPDLAELTRAVQAQTRLLEELRSRNEDLARTNQELIRRVQALESQAGQADLSPPPATGAQTPSEGFPAFDTGASQAAFDQRTKPPENHGAEPGVPMPPADPAPDIIVETFTGGPSAPVPNPGLPASGATVPAFAYESVLQPEMPVAQAAAAGQPVIQPLPKSDLGPTPSGPSAGAGEFFFGKYDNGFVLVAPKDPRKTPFAAKLNIVTQERYTGFSRQNEFWQPHNFRERIHVNNRSTFDVNRAYIGFSGFAIDPRLRYSMIVATTSVVNVTYLLGVIGFQFDKAFGLYGGFNKVPGSREWLESFKHTLGSDRSMATTFFRPSMSPGVWITGEPLTDFHYYGMISNSINSFDQFGDRQSTQMAYSGSIWWEPLGAFGPGFADEEFHESPALRLGGSGLFTRQDKEPLLGDLLNNPENTILRLSNGIPIFLPGALAPGVNLLATDDRLLAVDAGLKYRGFSLSGEYYFRWLNNFRTDKPLPGLTSVYDSGGYVQTSFALIPKRLEAFAKSSLVAGPFGSGNDYGGGLNWYVSGNRNWRITAEAIQVNRSPASNILTPFRTGQSGTIVMLQLLTDF